MKNLTPPTIDSIDFLHKAGKGLHAKVRDDNDNLKDNPKKKVLEDKKSILEAAYRSYDAHTNPMTLDELQPLWKDDIGDTQVQKNENKYWRDGIHNLYDRKKKIISDLWDSISVNSNRETILCPLCESEAVYELDHYIPREIMPEYSVHIKNLIPLCHRCNNVKLDSWLDDRNKRIIFNAYYDKLPNEDLLEANIIMGAVGGLPTIKIAIKSGIDLSNESNRIYVSTIKSLGLLEVFQRHANIFFKDKCVYLRNQFRNEKKRHKNYSEEEILQHIKEDIEATIQEEKENLNLLIYKEIYVSSIFEQWIKM